MAKKSEFTKRILDDLKAGNKDIIVYDDEVTGLFCKITPTGKKSFGLYYRTKEHTQRKPKIGDYSTITITQAREIAKDMLHEVAKGNDPSLDNKLLKQIPTINEMRNMYFDDYAKAKKKPLSVKSDIRNWDWYFAPAVGKLKINKVSFADMQKLHASLSHKKPTANRVISLASKFFNLCEKWGYRIDGSNPCRHIQKYKENPKERFLSTDEIKKLFEYLNKAEANGNITLSAIHAIKLLLLTGCRMNEILTLKWEYIDSNMKFAFLPDSKTGKKTVYISESAKAILESIQRTDNNPYVIVGKNDGKHLVNLNKPWRKIRASIGLENVRIHDLRHTLASIAAANGDNLLIIGKMLGHKSIASTARYAHLVADKIHESTNAVGNIIVNKK